MVNVKNNARWTPPTDAFSFTDADTDASLGMATVDAGANIYEALAIPDGSIELALRITMNSGRKFDATATLPTGGLTKSQHYTINLNLGKDRVKVSAVCERLG